MPRPIPTPTPQTPANANSSLLLQYFLADWHGCPLSLRDLGPVTSLNPDICGRWSLTFKPYSFIYFKVYFDVYLVGSDVEICSVVCESAKFLFPLCL